MKAVNFSLRRKWRNYWRKHRYKTKRIHKSWVGADAGLKAVLTDLFIVFQILLAIAVYAVAVCVIPYFFFVCCLLTIMNIVYVAIEERDVQSKISWILLFLVSFGCGFLIYIFANRSVCYGLHRRRYSKILKRLPPSLGGKCEINGLSEAAVTDCCAEVFSYLGANGFPSYTDTQAKYYSNARSALDNIIATVDGAQKFVFLEFFIVADGVYLERLISAFRRRIECGVEVYMLYDDVGSAGVLSDYAKKRLKSVGVHLKTFSKLFSPFYFGLNFRDHRKIVVVDGKVGFVGGFNLIDDCANERKMEGVWKDSGLRIEGAAVDGLSLSFMRQWEFTSGEKLDPERYLNLFRQAENCATYAPYAGGPEIKEDVCRNVYAKIIDDAKERLYIMTPYLIPDSGIMRKLKRKAMDGVDVRIVLPGVPDYRYIYCVTTANARRLLKSGVKIYYAGGEFVHGKVVLGDGIACVGSVNMDMRAFYQELDNGVVTDDCAVISQIEDDFKRLFERNVTEKKTARNAFTVIVTAILRIVSPLM